MARGGGDDGVSERRVCLRAVWSTVVRTTPCARVQSRALQSWLRCLRDSLYALRCVGPADRRVWVRCVCVCVRRTLEPGWVLWDAPIWRERCVVWCKECYVMLCYVTTATILVGGASACGTSRLDAVPAAPIGAETFLPDTFKMALAWMAADFAAVLTRAVLLQRSVT